MGLTKQYLRYVPVQTFGMIASPRSNIAFMNIDSIEGRYCVVGCSETLLVWDLRTGEKVLQVSNDDRKEVCQITASPNMMYVAAGLSNGNIEIYNVRNREVVCRLALHRTAVNCMRFDKTSSQLASGGLDTDIVISDVVTQTGQSRLIGHKGPITDVCFMSIFENILISSSKDTQVGLCLLMH